jgi:hypothetical protein
MMAQSLVTVFNDIADDGTTDLDWHLLTPDEQRSISAVGWIFSTFGLLLCAMLGYGIYEDRRLQQKNGEIGTADRPIPAHKQVTILIKILLLPTVFFRVLSLIGTIYFIVPAVIKCQDYPMTCTSIFFVLNLFFITPVFCLNAVFMLLCLFWSWLHEWLRGRHSSFEMKLLDWQILVAVMGFLTISGFMAASTVDDALPYEIISLFLQIIVLFNLFGFAWFGIGLLCQLQQSLVTSSTKKLYAFSFMVIIFQIIHIITVQIFNYFATQSENSHSYDWCITYILWSGLAELIPESILIVYLLPRTAWPRCCRSAHQPESDPINQTTSYHFTSESDYATSD